MKDEDIIIDDFVKPLEEIVDIMNSEDDTENNKN